MNKKYKRYLNLKEESQKKSLFLFGPRQTGKTYLLKTLFPDSEYYDLLRSDLYLKLSRRPQLIREELSIKKDKIYNPVIIDEIQKFPLLMDEVHYMIENFGITFILTCSSPRKLKKRGANLLEGRARTKYLFPLITAEIPDFDLLRALNFGTIPSIYLSDDPEEDLLAYCGNYLKEEIAAEGLVRRIHNFSNFLQLAALVNTELLNFSNIANDTGLPASTVREYFFILEDTLIGTTIHPYKKTKRRKSVSSSKFYFFDIGVCNSLAGRANIRVKTELFGKALEHLIFTEIKAFLSYSKDMRELSFWRTKSGDEVDFLIGDETAIEVKSSEIVTEKHLKGLRKLSYETNFKNYIVVSMDSNPRELNNIKILPVKHFLERLWEGIY